MFGKGQIASEVNCGGARPIGVSDMSELDRAMEDIKAYLLFHEDDIYYGINDFNLLEYAFEVLINRKPQAL